MKSLQDWGFSRDSWRGKRGEYWVLGQGALIVTFVLLPAYPPRQWQLPPLLQYGMWAIALVLALAALLLIVKGLLDLGRSLTPLPYPRDDGQLVQTGVYSMVRHSLYSGLILAAIAWTIYSLSLFHLIATIVGFIFFDAKATQEESWLVERYPDYVEYRKRVKKLIPWLY